jgi:hypothetical protein
MSEHAYERVAAGRPMPGVFEADQSIPIGHAIEDLILIVECSLPDEWEGRVIHLPL